MSHCGRLDPHKMHVVPGYHGYLFGTPYQTPDIHCRGLVTTEGGATCVICQGPVASCTCYAELVAQRGREWYA